MTMELLNFNSSSDLKDYYYLDSLLGPITAKVFRAP
jgi:hypothetical protein